MAEKRRLYLRDEKARTDLPPDLSTSHRKEKYPINAPVPIQVNTRHAHYSHAHEREDNTIPGPKR